MYIRKSMAILLIIIFISAFTGTNASAQLKTIYQTSTVETITSGATLEQITRFTDLGWLSINVLKINLKDPNIKIDTMSSPQSLRKLTSTGELARLNGAVAAVNGGFFTWTNEPGIAHPVGPVMESEKLVSATSDKDKFVMGTLSITKMNEVLYHYWQTKITLIAPTGKNITVGRYNKPYYGHYDFTVIDRRWKDTTYGTAGAYDIVEMLVVDGKVSEIRQAQPPAAIPANGYAVITRKEGGKVLLENFKPGDEVKLSITTNPDWTGLKTAIPGGAIIVRGGKVLDKFTHEVTGRHPRTGIGSSKDGGTLYLVTVDGRQNTSFGVTQAELAQIMFELGAHDALNLDGGGSTTMVKRTPGTSKLELANSPSDGSQRRITTAIGIFSLAPPSELAGLMIDTEDTNTFVNTSRVFSVKGYDRYFNPVEVKPEDVKWSVSGLEGSFKGNVLYPTSVGAGKVIATVGEVTAEKAINSLSSPVQLILSENSIRLTSKKTRSFTVSGKNKNGYYAGINPADVTWTVNGDAGRVTTGGAFTAAAEGTGYIDASVGETHAYCSVAIESEKVAYTDGFEAANGTFLAYPATVPGAYEISGEQLHTGSASGKLTYDFSNVEITRAAYLVFDNGGIPLDVNTTRLGLWVYSTHENPNWLRAEVYDSNNKKHLVDIQKGMEWTGWKYLETSLAGIKSPSLLTRLYLAQPNPVADTGCIYLDDLTLISAVHPEIDMSTIPQDTVPVDEANKAVTYKKTADSFRFSVFGEAREPENPLEKLLSIKLAEKTNKYLEASAYVGSSSHDTAKAVKKPYITTGKGYKSFDMSNSKFIQLDMSGKGLRLSDPLQWSWLLNQLGAAKGNNVFIFLADSPAAFTDTMEAGLFQDILTRFKQQSRKNVWVFYKGDKNASYMERGIKYITLAGFDVEGLTPDNTDAAKYLLVTVKGATITYEFKPIV